tara:strand:+ start:406 stop:603 length:198 start_codon:yes stop_codon:yes gene_type:complete
MIDTNEVMNKVMADNVVENIAQMNLEQRNIFVNTFVEKWPDLATSLSNMITLEQMVKNTKEKNDY